MLGLADLLHIWSLFVFSPQAILIAGRPDLLPSEKGEKTFSSGILIRPNENTLSVFFTVQVPGDSTTARRA